MLQAPVLVHVKIKKKREFLCDFQGRCSMFSKMYYYWRVRNIRLETRFFFLRFFFPLLSIIEGGGGPPKERKSRLHRQLKSIFHLNKRFFLGGVILN